MISNDLWRRDINPYFEHIGMDLGDSIYNDMIITTKSSTSTECASSMSNRLHWSFESQCNFRQ